MRFNTVNGTDIQISEIGLGTWEISGDVWGRKDDTQSMRAIHTALDAGVNYIDTAAGYGKGHAEELVGKVLEQRGTASSNIVVSTKVLPQCGIFAPPPEKDISEFFSREWIIQQCEASLRRLQIEQIGMLFLHTWSRSWGHSTEWYEALTDLKQEGKIRAFGISIPDEGIADANVHVEAGRVDVIMCVYNIFQQEPEYTLFPLAKKHNVAIIARSPLSSGALVGNWTTDMSFPDQDWRGLWPASIGLGTWLQEQVTMAETIRPIIEAEGLAMTLAALKFVLRNQVVTSVIPGSARPEHVQLNISALDSAPLSHSAVQALKDLWLTRQIHGTYNGSI